ncbi:hypothetical protein MMC22_009432 [Lobaria immixta]|nr:hypothetical protein [Lobaria immixta]
MLFVPEKAYLQKPFGTSIAQSIWSHRPLSEEPQHDQKSSSSTSDKSGVGSRCGTFTLGGFVGLSGLPPTTLPVGLVILPRRTNALDESLWSRGSSINEEIDVFLEEVDVALLVVVRGALMGLVDDSMMSRSGVLEKATAR